jgi:two-component system response regulator QseB
VLPDGTQVSLPAREFELLRVPAARPAAVHPRAMLRSGVFDEAAAASIVDTYVAAVPPVSAGRGSRCR